MRRPAVGAVLAATAALLAVAVAGAAEAPSRDVTMPGKLYEPAHVSVLVGTTVTWHNGDAVNHTVTADGGAFDSGYLAAGGSFSFTFDRPGHYAYHCVIHRFMKGTVDVFSLVLTGPEAPVSAGRPVLLAGLAPAGTVAVTLRRVGADSGLVVKPRPDGSFTVRFTATGPGAYRASVGAAVSPLVRIGVVPHVTAVRAGAALVARADPPRPGARVVLQAYDRELFGWRTIARARLDRTSRARLPLGSPLPERVRVLVRADGGWSDGASPAIVLHG